MPAQTTATLAVRAARLLAQRWPLYLVSTVLVLVAETAISLGLRIRFADVVATLVAGPVLVAILNVHLGADGAESALDGLQRWERVLQRLWAVIVIDFIVAVVFGLGLSQTVAPSGDPSRILTGAFALVLAGALLYADVFACLEEGVSTAALVPFALLRSATLAWQNMSRIFFLLALQIALFLVETYAQIGLARAHVPHAQFWATVPLGTLLAVPLTALTVVFYLDAAGREHTAAH